MIKTRIAHIAARAHCLPHRPGEGMIKTIFGEVTWVDGVHLPHRPGEGMIKTRLCKHLRNASPYHIAPVRA